MSKQNDIIKMIHDNHLEVETWKYLNNYMEQRLIKVKGDLMEKKATIRAISKINQNKNEAISALCE